jgi:hypothetical protein
MLSRSGDSTQQMPLLLRPAPGEKASAFALTYWLIAGDGRAQLVWDSGPGVIKVVFDPGNGTTVDAEGLATNYSDVLDAAPDEVSVRVKRFDCFTAP